MRNKHIYIHMQIFVVGTVIYTASVLDKKRFNNQITEARNYPKLLKESNLHGWMKIFIICIELDYSQRTLLIINSGII